MAEPDTLRLWSFVEPEAVLSSETHRNIARGVHEHRDRLTPAHAAADPDVLDAVYLAGTYYLERLQHLPEGQVWDHHAYTLLLRIVHAVRPASVPQPLRDGFAEHPPGDVPAYETVHAVGRALLAAGTAAKDPEAVLVAGALLGHAFVEARGQESGPHIAFGFAIGLKAMADLGVGPEDARARGITLMRRALAELPTDDQFRDAMLAELASALAKAPPQPPAEGSPAAEVGAYMRGGGLERLDDAVDRLRTALATSATAEPERSLRRAELGQVLRMRFETTGELTDLDASVTELRAALAGGALDAELRASVASFLGLAHLDRYVHTQDPADLEAATTAVRDGCDPAVAASPAHPQRLTNLAAVLTARYDLYERQADLDEAVEHLTFAVAATPPAQHDHPVMAVKLAVALGRRGTHRRGAEDLRRAEAILRQVADGSPGAGPIRQLARMELAELLADRGALFGDDRAIAEAVEQYGATALTPTEDIRTRLRCAYAWGVHAASLGALDLAREGFRVALTELLPKLTGPALGRESQETRLREVSSLATVAATASVMAGRPQEALVRLEQGRGVLLAQALRLRGRHDDLAAVSRPLAERFERVCAELVARQRGPEERKAAAAEYDQVVRDIRALEDWEDFQRPLGWERLSEAAADGPVAVINVSAWGCSVLLVTRPPGGPGRVDRLPLDVTEDEIGRRAEVFRTAVTRLGGATGRERLRADQELKDTLRWLGARIVRPVLAHLDLAGPPDPGASPPRLWWCPTGVLSLLPLHAAVLEDGPDGPVHTHDRVVSSFTPTLGALLHARSLPVTGEQPASLLAVAVDARGAHPPLAALDDELAAIGAAPGRRDVLRGTEATPRAVLAALRGHTHAHLACHGVRDPGDPARSRLLLHGGELTLRELAGERLTDARFAYLSACHSAAPGEELADEVISVASAFQLCGYRQVIGSLWTVDDRMGPLLAREVYRHLAAPGTPPAAVALHRAIGVLRAHPRYRDPLFWGSVIHHGL
ncbi:CHAT domain-containing protein [Streptomyces sp. NPDC047841]|uniref:CHAT domain-containing protein n=1 Tax=Streptomyces sp. NPDC047841 TaxID=3154708 RepID=UPI003456F4E2